MEHAARAEAGWGVCGGVSSAIWCLWGLKYVETKIEMVTGGKAGLFQQRDLGSARLREAVERV